MAVGKFMKSSGIAALVAGLAVLTVPAQAQERGGWGGRGGGTATAQQNGGNRGGDGSGWRGNGNGGGWRGGDGNGGNRGFRSEQSGSTTTAAPVEARPQRNWSRNDGSGGNVTGGSARWQGRGDGGNAAGGNRWNGSRNRPADQAQAAPVQQQPSQVEAQRRAWNGNGTSQWQGRDRDRERAASNQNWRNDNNANRWRSDNNSNWRGNDAWRGSNRETWRNNDRQSLSRNWNRDWRRDNRYDWRGWRSSNRDVFRLGAYSAPYRNYSYRRLNSGFYLDTLFFGSRYWINDPWQYRLPPAYGPYRWIRYYDDALLVDTYSGEVVDVIYDFFW